jgi:hypothetical protein
MTQFLKVEGHTSLIRDVNSNAIISTNNDDFDAYKKKTIAENRRMNMFSKQATEIDLMKKDISDIKDMLTKLLRGLPNG